MQDRQYSIKQLLLSATLAASTFGAGRWLSWWSRRFESVRVSYEVLMWNDAAIMIALAAGMAMGLAVGALCQRRLRGAFIGVAVMAVVLMTLMYKGK